MPGRPGGPAAVRILSDVRDAALPVRLLDGGHRTCCNRAVAGHCHSGSCQHKHTVIHSQKPCWTSNTSFKKQGRYGRAGEHPSTPRLSTDVPRKHGPQGFPAEGTTEVGLRRTLLEACHGTLIKQFGVINLSCKYEDSQTGKTHNSSSGNLRDNRSWAYLAADSCDSCQYTEQLKKQACQNCSTSKRPAT